MFDQLGDRDYDCFEPDQHEYLKDKIGFALYGPPKTVNGWTGEEKINIMNYYQLICSENGKSLLILIYVF